MGKGNSGKPDKLAPPRPPAVPDSGKGEPRKVTQQQRVDAAAGRVLDGEPGAVGEYWAAKFGGKR